MGVRVSSSSLFSLYSFAVFYFAEIAQLVEHNLAKVGVASSSLVFRSRSLEWWNGRHEGLKILWAEMSVRVRVSLRAHYTIADLHYASQLFFICFSSSLEQLINLFTADDKEQFATHLVRSHTVTHRTQLRRRSTHELDRQTRRQHQQRNRSTRPQFTSSHAPTQLPIRHPPRQRKPTPQHPSPTPLPKAEEPSPT